MPRRIAIAMFVDACGWGVVEPRSWWFQSLTHRRSVRSLFGFSSACVPAILTGRRPDEIDHWSTFFYSPSTSPFRHLRHLARLPSSLVDRGRVRRYLSAAIAAAYGYRGYFQIYNLPFEILPYYDYAEKKDIFRPGGINRGTSIFDDLTSDRIPYHVSEWRRPEKSNFQALGRALVMRSPAFAFLYAAGLDSLMHSHTKDSAVADAKLHWYQREVEELLAVAHRGYDEVRFALFSDHGMATVSSVRDWVPLVEATGLRFGEDYAAVYDSTMMRFWFLRPHAESRIRDALADGEQARWVTRAQLEEYGTYWPDGKFGDAVYALEPGVILNPSHMGNVAPRGMHGYRPDDPDSDAALLANFDPQTPVRDITDLYRVMREMADWAAEALPARRP
jgi:hypothetical protein